MPREMASPIATSPVALPRLFKTMTARASSALPVQVSTTGAVMNDPDNDFVPPTPMPTQIVGYSADPTQKENWETDFEDLDLTSAEPASASGRFNWAKIDGVGTPTGNASTALNSHILIRHSSGDSTQGFGTGSEQSPERRHSQGDIENEIAFDDDENPFGQNDCDDVKKTAIRVDTNLHSGSPDIDESVLSVEDQDSDGVTVLAAPSSSSSEGDWDNMFDDEDGEDSTSVGDSDFMSNTMQKQVTSLLRSYLAPDDAITSNSPANTASHRRNLPAISRRHRLLRILHSDGDTQTINSVNNSSVPYSASTASTSTVKIVVYPKPSVLFSEHTEEGRSSFRESVLEEWLTGLAEKSSRAYLSVPDRLPSSSLSSPATALTQPVTIPHLSEWLRSCLVQVHSFYRQRGSSWASEKCWESVSAVMEALALAQFHISESVSEHHARPLFDMLHAILYESAKTLPNKSKLDTFAGFITTSIAVFPRYQGHLELLLLSTIAHWDATRINRVLRQYIVVFLAHNRFLTTSSGTEGPSPSASGQAPSHGRSTSVSGHGVVLPTTPTLKAGTQTSSIQLHAEVAVEALVSLDLYLNQYSPLNTSVLAGDAPWDIDDDVNIGWLEHAQNELPPTPDLINVPAMSPSQLSQETEMWRLCGSAQARIECMERLYALLEGPTLPRARCAYVMGHYALHHHNDTGLAERLLFECIFLLDRSRALLASQIPLISELGTSALIAYGDILLSNGKYKYAILSLEAAVAVMKLRRGTESHAMDRRLCDVCSENRDWDRSLKYHLEILREARSQENVAEFVYLSQQVSKIFTEIGDWPAAESQLVDALAFITQVVTRTIVSPITPRSASILFEEPVFESHQTLAPNSTLDDSIHVPASGGTVGRYSLKSTPRSAYASRSVGRRTVLSSNIFASPDLPSDSKSSFLAINNISLANSPSSVAMSVDSAPSSSSLHISANNISSSIHHTSKSKFRAARLGLYIRLAQLYLDGGRHVDAVVILQSTLDADLARGKAPLVKLLLAKACMKLRLVDRVVFLFDELSSDSTGSDGDASYIRGVSTLGIFRSSSAGVVNSPEFLNLRITSLLQRGLLTEALLSASAAVRLCTQSNLAYLGRFHFLQGKCLHGLAMQQLDSLVLHIGAPSLEGLPDLNQCVSCYSAAFEYFSKINDSYRAAKTLAAIAQAYLDVLVVLRCALHWSLTTLEPWLISNGFDSSSSPLDSSCFKRIEMPAHQALDCFAECLDPLRLLSSLMSFAELRAVQYGGISAAGSSVTGTHDQELLSQAISYWKEVRDSFLTLFMSETQFASLIESSAGFRLRAYRLFSRMVRLLLMFDGEIIKKNIYVLDSYLMFQIQIDAMPTIGARAPNDDEMDRDGAMSENGRSPSESPDRTRGRAGVSGKSHSASAQASPSRTARILMAGKKRLGLGGFAGSRTANHANSGGSSHISTSGVRGDPNDPSSQSGSLRVQCSDDDLLFRIIPLRFSSEKANSVSIADCVSCYSQVHRNCELFASNRLTQSEVFERNRTILRRLLRIMTQLRAADGRGPTEYSPPTSPSVTDPSRHRDPIPTSNSDSMWHRGSSNRLQHGLYRQLVYCISVGNLSVVFGPRGNRVETAVGPPETQNLVLLGLFDQRPTKKFRPEFVNLGNSNKVASVDIDGIDLQMDPASEQDGLNFLNDEQLRGGVLDDPVQELQSDVESPVSLPALSMSCVSQLFAHLDSQHILTVIAALLTERSVIVISTSQTLIVSAIHSLVAFLYPFTSQHVYIPLMSRSSLSNLELASPPYLVGLRASLRPYLNARSLPALIVDLDKNRIEFPADRPIVQLPSKTSSRIFKVFVKFMSAIFLQRAELSNSNIGPAPRSSSLIINSSHSPLLTAIPPSNFETRERFTTLAYSATDDTELFPTLLSLQRGVFEALARLLFPYRSRWDPRSQTPEDFDMAAFLQDAKFCNRAFLCALIGSGASTFASFLKARCKCSQGDFESGAFDQVVITVLKEKFTKMVQFENVSLSASLLAAHNGKKSLKRRWCILSERRLSVFGSRRAAFKKNATAMHTIDLLPGVFTVISPFNQSDDAFAIGISDQIVWRFQTESHGQRKEWSRALAARSVTDLVRRRWEQLAT